MAAVLAAGPGAVLSHRSASALWGLTPAGGGYPTVTSPRRLSRPGIEAHRAFLPADEVTALREIPVSTVPRTILDLAAVLDLQRLRRIIHEAEVARHLDELSLHDLLARYRGRRGTRGLVSILAERSSLILTRSELEFSFHAFLEETALPRPQVNVSVQAHGRWFECDCVWHAQRLVVELDGRAFHAPAASFERDRERDRLLQSAGWRVVRITWHQLEDDRAGISRDLNALLGRVTGRAE